MMAIEEALGFKEILLEHLRKILEISRKEFRGGYWEISGDNPPTRTYISDTRACYSQAVLSLSDILQPLFDETMKKEYKEINKKLKPARELLRGKLDELEKKAEKVKKDCENNPTRSFNQEKYNKIVSRLEKDYANREYFYNSIKMPLIKKLFQQLCFLLNRLDYLAGESYEEEDSEGDEE